MDTAAFDNWTHFVRAVRDWKSDFECTQTAFEAFMADLFAPRSDKDAYRRVDEFWARHGLAEGAEVYAEGYGKGKVVGPKKAGLIIEHKSEEWHVSQEDGEEWDEGRYGPPDIQSLFDFGAGCWA